MYIDPNQRSMEQEVNEATAKLKGLLGIGVGGDDRGASAPDKRGGGAPVVVGGKPPTANKYKRHRNKNKQNSRQRAGGDIKDGSQPKPQAQQQQQPNRSKSPQSQSQTLQKDGNKKEANKRGKGKGKNNNRKNHKDKDTQKDANVAGQASSVAKDGKSNFAWSAFQSSPDASKLPIPAFSPFTQKHEVAISALDAAEHAENVLAPLLPVPPAASKSTPQEIKPELENAPKAEDFENQVTLRAKIDLAETEPKSDEKEVEDTGPPPSKTGINLAALTSATADQNPTSTKAAGGASLAPSSTLTQHQSMSGITQHQHQPQPSHHMNYNQYHHPHQHNPYPQMSHQYHPPPPGYLTIQVQVPSVLMPGRQMVVQSPAGYPVQVVLPAEIPPGAVIPVHVPVGPPLHMMPPQQQQQTYQHHHQLQRSHQQQQQRYYNRSGGTS